MFEVVLVLMVSIAGAELCRQFVKDVFRGAK